MELTAAGRTDIGLVRAKNEDNFYVDTERGILVVADGMGGHAAGEMASRITVNMIRDYFNGQQKMVGEYDKAYSDATNKLHSAIRLANLAVYEAAQGLPQLKGMGTTVAAVLIDGKRLSIAHIGDSRVYLVRSGNIEQLTDDHSMVCEQVKRDLITQEEAAASPMKNILMRALGVKPDADADLDELILFDEDRLLLCTDGLNTMVTDDAMMQMILSSDHPASACSALIDAANTAGGKDNVTAVLGRVRQPQWYSFLFKILESLRR